MLPNIAEPQTQAGVYALIHRASGAIYVGMSLHCEQRRQKHFRDLRYGGHHNSALVVAAGARFGTFRKERATPGGHPGSRGWHRIGPP